MSRSYPKPLKPGSCTLRLALLPSLSPSQKTALVSSISTDIAATFIYIAKAAETGLLDSENTESLDTVIRMIKDTAISRRERLEEKVASYQRRLRRYRRKYKRRMRWVRMEFRNVVSRADLALKSRTSVGVSGSKRRGSTGEL
ncbi:hypothetical protein MPDQ_007182 [Monascus purpureus]|uniref:Uncharacterized protein n=1 Tax=Monascus purpureus TaxID=5098 RepID=A0A507QWL4_MONPU|nr:hypothetical protein MPDQ_007182 [Monascus purpureus]BDD63752.1 hypothetical protein MAP00_008615 [Monascus purpureus]